MVIFSTLATDKDVLPENAMEGVTLQNQRSVLIVDESEETREVLQTALERRGMRILSARHAKRGLELARQHHPDLIVLDMELDDSASESFSDRFAEQSDGSRTPLVMLGSVRRTVDGLPRSEFVAKPYHYGALIRRIEELLDTNL